MQDAVFPKDPSLGLYYSLYISDIVKTSNLNAVLYAEYKSSYLRETTQNFGKIVDNELNKLITGFVLTNYICIKYIP